MVLLLPLRRWTRLWKRMSSYWPRARLMDGGDGVRPPTRALEQRSVRCEHGQQRRYQVSHGTPPLCLGWTCRREGMGERAALLPGVPGLQLSYEAYRSA